MPFHHQRDDHSSVASTSSANGGGGGNGGGGLYGRRNETDPTSPIDSSIISSSVNATSLWSRPIRSSTDTPTTCISPSTSADKDKLRPKPRYSLEPRSDTSKFMPPAFRRQKTDWTDATSVVYEEPDPEKAFGTIVFTGVQEEPPTTSESQVSASSATGSCMAIKSPPAHLRPVSEVSQASYSSRPASGATTSKSPIPSSPVKAKDLIRFFETETRSSSEPPSPSKMSLRSAKKVLLQMADEQGTPGRLTLPFATCLSNSFSPLNTPEAVSPLGSKLRHRGAMRMTARSRALLGVGGGASGKEEASDDENVAPSASAETTPTRNSIANRNRLSASPSAERNGVPGIMSLVAGFDRPTHTRSGSTPVGASTSTANGHQRNNSTLSTYRSAADCAANSASEPPPVSTGTSRKRGNGFPFHNSVMSIVSAFSGKNNNQQQQPRPDPLEAHRQEKERERQRRGSEQEDNISVASGMTLGTTASYKQKTERGNLALSSASAVELSGEPASTRPIRSGVLYYFNVHQREAHWQRVQLVLLPTAVAMSWIPAGGGRENVVLDLRACREVHSVPSPDHPSSTSDIGAIRARKQGLYRLSPFQLIFDDGIERLAADSASERVKWVNSIWDITGVAPTPESEVPPPIVTRIPPPTEINAQSFRQPRSASSSPDKRTAGNRSVNTMEEGIDRIGSIWKSEISSDQETREGHPSIAEALGTGPPVPPKTDAGRPAFARNKVRSWRLNDETDADPGHVREQTQLMANLIQPAAEEQIRSIPVSFASDDKIETQTLNNSAKSADEPIASKDLSATAAAATPEAAASDSISIITYDYDDLSSKAAELDAPPESSYEEASSPMEESPDLNGYESAHSHSSQVDEFGPRTPHSDAVFNWTRPDKEDREIRPLDSASQRPARSDTISTRASYDSRREEIVAAAEDARTPAQKIRDSALNEEPGRLGTVIEETQSQAQSTRLTGTLTPNKRKQRRGASDVDEVIASSEVARSNMKSPFIYSSVSNGSISSQDVHKLLEHLEEQQRSRAARDQYLEEQIRSFQDVIAGLQNRAGSVHSKKSASSSQRRSSAPTSGESRSSSARDAELAAMQEKLDKVLDLVTNVVGQRAAPMPVNEWEQLPSELRGSQIIKTFQDRARYGRDGRHEAIAQDHHARNGSSPPETPLADLNTPMIAGSSVSMSDLESVPSGRIPPRSWVSAEGVPSPPPNSEWDVNSIRGSTHPGARGSFTPRTPAQNIRIHGDPQSGSTPRPALGPAQASAGSLDMEVEIRKRRAKQQAASGNPQGAGWYTSKPATVTDESDEQAIINTPKPGVPDTPGVKWAPSDSSRQVSVAGLGLSLPSSNKALPEVVEDGSQTPTVVGGTTRHNSLAPNGELGVVLDALKQNELARQAQIKQQGEIARYLNELNAWLEKDVVDRSKEWRTLATGVTQLHDELLTLKQGRPVSFSMPVDRGISAGSVSMDRGLSAPDSVGNVNQLLPSPDNNSPRTMPIPATMIPGAAMSATNMALPPATVMANTPVVVNPFETPPAPNPSFGNGGKWTNLATPNPNASPRRAQTRTWHATPPPGVTKNQDAWYRPDDLVVSKDSPSKATKVAAGVGGALLIRAALKEWDKFKAKQRSKGLPEDPAPPNSSGDPVADPKMPLPQPLEEGLKMAADQGNEEGVTTLVRAAAEQGLGTQAIVKLTKHIESNELEGATLEAPTPSPHRTRFNNVPEIIVSDAGKTESIASPEGPSTGALALAVEEILKHLLERKEEEKRLAQARALAEETSKEKEKTELVELILSRLSAEKAKQDPKSAIESLVTALNTQNHSRLTTDNTIKEMATTLLKTTTEQNGKLVEAVNTAARDTLRYNLDAHAEELKRQLSREVTGMFEDVGKIREAKRALEHEIADLFAIKSRHLGPPQQGWGQQGGWVPPHAITMPAYGQPPMQQGHIEPLPPQQQQARSLGNEEPSGKAMKKAAKAAAAPVAPAPAAAAQTAGQAVMTAALTGLFTGKKDVLNPFSVNFGPRAPR